MAAPNAAAPPAPAARRERPRSPLGTAWRRFRRSRVGMVGAGLLIALYLIALFAGFLSPYAIATQHYDYPYIGPQSVHVVLNGRLERPFVYAIKRKRDPETYLMRYAEDRSRALPIRFLVHGEDYKLFGLIHTDLHLFGVSSDAGDAYYFPLGTDKFGRDLLSRMLVGSQVSLTVGIIGILISYTIGVLMGGISGFYGGTVDALIQRLIEVLLSFPRLPILLALSYVIPASWPSSSVYLGIVAVLALIGWASLARVVRGQVLSARDLDYTQAARALGASDFRIILRHVLPNLTSYLIVSATLSLPYYILGESTLSFLGLGVKEPMTSWGLLLKDAQNFETLHLYPWMLLPGLMIVLSVLAFNFAGDALRDAADTQSR